MYKHRIYCDICEKEINDNEGKIYGGIDNLSWWFEWHGHLTDKTGNVVEADICINCIYKMIGEQLDERCKD